MRVLMTGGGTAGHVNPALAIADEIRKREPDSKIMFVGTSHGIENKLIPAAGYEIYHIEVQGIRRSLSPANIKTAYLALTSVGKAKALVKEFKPDIAIGTGGYVSWPLIKAAHELGVPTALHESNAVPGFAVKMLERYTDLIFTNFAGTINELKRPERALRVGNPLRGGFETIDSAEAVRKLGLGGYRSRILSFGGSMGAERVNCEVIDMMAEYVSRHPEIYHIHATGSLEYPAASAMFREHGLDKFPNLKLTEYIYDMPYQMSAADLVICRAGAMTLSELALLRKACVLIPSPNVTNNHQYKNARALADAGAAALIEEKDLTGAAGQDGKSPAESRLTRTVRELLDDAPKADSMREAIGKFASGDAAETIYREILGLIGKKA